jgi:arylsulfatase A-like enzyme
MYDTLRHDYMGYKGLRSVQTPNWDRFAESSKDFTRCYAGSYPSLPHRCDCATGRLVFPFYGWRDLPEDEINLCQKLTDAGYRTHTIADEDMFARCGPGRGFQSNDIVSAGVKVTDEEVASTPLPCAAHKSRNPDQLRKKWALRNKLIENGEEDAWPQARLMNAASAWIEKHAGNEEPFFLWIESWRIHETWIDPPEYVDLYDPGYAGEKVALPAYSPTTDYLTDAELNHVRAMYAGAITFSDKCFGVLLEALERKGVLDDTLVILTADHGYSLGDHGRTGKHGVPNPPQEPWPLYEECVHVPLLIHAPKQARPARCEELVQHADILPTLLDFAGIDPGPTARGVSWKPILEGETLHTRDIAVTCAGLDEFPNSGNTRVTITSKEYSLILPTDTQEAELYDLCNDPDQTQNLFAEKTIIAENLHQAFVHLIRDLGMDGSKLRSWENILFQKAEAVAETNVIMPAHATDGNGSNRGKE